MIKKEKEVWRTFPDCPFIEASNLGRIRTKDRTVTRKNGRKCFVKGRVLKQQCDRYGYMYVEFRVSGKLVILRVHRIVATCFLPNPNGYLEVNHIDNNPKNNAVSNLEWCDHQYNMDYKKKCGTSPAQVQGQPVIAVDLDSFEVFCFESQSEAARQLGIDVRMTNKVVKGKQNKTHGWWFCNADENAVEKVREKFGDCIAEKVEKLMDENYN